MTQSMLAMQAFDKGDVRLTEVPVPTPTDGQVLVKMELASICGSDLHIVDYGWLVEEYPLRPGYPGHEGIGTIVEANGTDLKNGDRVLVTPAIWGSLCFAEYQALGTNFLTVLPEASDQQPDHLLMAQQLGTVIFAAKLETCRLVAVRPGVMSWQVILQEDSIFLWTELASIRHLGFLSEKFQDEEQLGELLAHQARVSGLATGEEDR